MRFIMSIALITASLALLVLNTTPYVQATSAPPPNCISALPSPVQGTPMPAPTAAGTLFINEVLTNPNYAWNCADQSPSTKDAWIELYNGQNQTIELTAWHFNIYDTTGDNLTYTPPAAFVIAAHGFLVVFPFPPVDMTPNIYRLQLVVANTIIDSVNIPTLLPGQSYARIPDGSANWQVSNYPTIGTSNSLNPPPPTPTPIKVKKSRTLRTKTPKAKSNSNNGYQSDTTNPTDSSTADLATNDGSQPSWNTLQLPDGTALPSSTPATITPASTTPTPQQSSAASDVPKKIVITASVVTLAAALLWCWKHFLSP